MAFFTQAVNVLKILVMAVGAGLGAWGVINLMEGYVMTIVRHVHKWKAYALSRRTKSSKLRRTDNLIGRMTG